MKAVIIALLIIAFALPALAQDPESVIAEVAADPAFAPGLEVTDGWWGQTYPPGNRWGVWRVEFYDSESNELGWAFYHPDQGVLYHESYIPSSEEQRLAGAEVIEAFLRQSEEAAAYIGEGFEVWWIEYDPWNDHWTAYLGVEGEGIAFVITFAEPGNPNSLDDPQVEHIWFTSVVTYEEWRSEMSAQAVAIAFNDPAVGDQVRVFANWTGEADPLQGDEWEVRFLSGGAVVARVVVDMAAGTVLSIE